MFCYLFIFVVFIVRFFYFLQVEIWSVEMVIRILFKRVEGWVLLDMLGL